MAKIIDFRKAQLQYMQTTVRRPRPKRLGKLLLFPLFVRRIALRAGKPDWDIDGDVA